MAHPTRRMRELFSGVPRDKRARRIIVSLQAYIDDSQTDDEVLVFAGYIARFEQWEEFSIEWQRLLDGPPIWKRFKMSEIALSRDPARWERAGAFYRVAEEHAEAFVAVAIELKALERAANDSGLAEATRRAGMPDGRLSDPYMIAHRAIVDGTMQYQKSLDLHDPIDFIFDEYKHKRRVRIGWETFVDTRSDGLRGLLGKEPRFENDEKFLPLQAADMIAWHAREHWLKHGSLTADRFVLSWKPKRNPRGYRFNLGYEDLLDHLTETRKRAEEVGLFARKPSVTIRVTFSGLRRPEGE